MHQEQQVVAQISQIVSIAQANQATGSIESMYFGLVMAGYYLPKQSCSAITANYLLGVATKKLFSLKQEIIEIGQLVKRTTKAEILSIIKEFSKQELGFDELHQPDKTWAINVLKTLKPEHNVFKTPGIASTSGLTQDDLALIQQLDTSLGRNKKIRYFRRNKDQMKEYKATLLKQKEKTEKRVIEKKKLKIQQLTQDIATYDAEHRGNQSQARQRQTQ